MSGSRCLIVSAATAAVLLAATAAPASAAQTGGGAYVLTATSTGSTYAPTFTGNGELGVRVPPAGQGYLAGTVPSQSELAGFYAQPSGDVQQRANIPTWSTLDFADGGVPFSPGAGTTTEWRQSIDLHTGIVATSARWKAPDGHVTDLRYQVLTDRARPNVGLVRLTLMPHWSGAATVTDVIDGTPATLTTQLGKDWDMTAGQDWVTVGTQGTAIEAAIASQLQASPNVNGTRTKFDQSTDQSVGQRLSFQVTGGRTYTFTKYVGIESSPNSDPTAAARAQSSSAAAAGFAPLLSANAAAWADLWKGRIDVLGDTTLATDVNASEFYLWSSTTAGVDWSISPAGLSSNGYDGHIFWDAETWMYPTLLAQHPDIAAGINAYRFERLGAAEQHAQASGWEGARFPWESALDGTEQIPPPVSVNSEGLYEQHITSDIALAQWQYYLATGDQTWLVQQGWPVLEGAAQFWASRAAKDSNGNYHLNNVTGPDEENPDVNDEAYTNVAAKTTLTDAIQAAHVLGLTVPASWAQIAAKLVVPVDGQLGIHPEFAGYEGQLVKQADVTLLQYPWSQPMPASTAAEDLDYYTVRSDPGGPSMTDAIGNIDAAAQGTPGCSSFVYTERSYQPFIRDVFHQFSETRTGGAFTFMTGIGGFLQEFLYGYSGMRWSDSGVELNPSLTSQLSGVVLRNLQWRGRTFTVAIGPSNTTVSLTSGPALPVITPSGTNTVAPGGTLTLATRRPDTRSTPDRVRCQNATASSSQVGADPLAAVDGSPATDWAPAKLPASLTSPFTASSQTVDTVTVLWGRLWPPAPGPNIPPPPGPVTTLRASDYIVQVSSDGYVWHRVATVSSRTTCLQDTLHFASTHARFVRIRITKAATDKDVMLEELRLTG